MSMNRVDFETADDLINYLLEDQEFRIRNVFDATSRGVNGRIFRGQPSITTQLLPSAHRHPSRFAHYVPQPPSPIPSAVEWNSLDSRARCLHLMGWMHAEVRAVHLFLEQADKLGLETPLDYQALYANQPTVDAVAKGEEGAWTRSFPEPAYLPAIAMAQHYGIPTRLLDFSESPLVAAYFAACEVSSALANHEATEAERLAIYVLDTRGLDRRFEGRIAVASAPRHRNHNLKAQSGLFVYLPRANEEFMNSGRWPSVDAVLASNGHQHRLKLLTLPALESDDLLRILRGHAISRHHLMPNLSNAAQAFNYERSLFKRDQ
jgi:hypothetical protein